MAARMKRLQVGDIITAEARIVFSDGRARMLAAELKTAPHLWRTLRVDGTVSAKASIVEFDVRRRPEFRIFD